MTRFCPSCGFGLDVKKEFEPKYCSSCGLKLASKVDFCPKCGKRPVDLYKGMKKGLLIAWLALTTLGTFVFIVSLAALYLGY